MTIKDEITEFKLVYEPRFRTDDLIHSFLDSTAEPVKVGCEADEECPLDKACHNTLCVNPCQCGINAECTVINHKPLCYCPPGYSGNPEVECQKRKLKNVLLKEQLI